MSEIDWDKAPEGYPLWLEYLQKTIDSDESMLESGGCWVLDRGDRYVTMFDTFWSKPEEGFYRIHERPSQAWNGEGLPPVGAVCEANFVGEWTRFEMRYYGEAYVVFKTAFEVQRTRHDFDTCGVKFRQIRTPEQIAADERDAAVNEMKLIAGFTLEGECQFSRLYDAGWRKQPKP